MATNKAHRHDTELGHRLGRHLGPEDKEIVELLSKMNPPDMVGQTTHRQIN